MTNKIIEEIEKLLYAQKDKLLSAIRVTTDTHLLSALHIALESIRDDLAELPMIDPRENEYYEELERKNKYSLPRLTPLQELAAFNAYDIVNILYVQATLDDDDKLYRRMKVYKDAQRAIPNRYVSPDMIRKAREYPVRQVLEGRLNTTVGRLGFCLCPLHFERTPSFKLFLDNTWHCFGCNEGGGSIDLLMKSAQLSFHDAVEELQY